jgi:long-chain acyl-CoA synthetase
MQVDRLFDIPLRQKALFPKGDAIATKEAGEWRSHSIEEIIEISEKLALGLISIGVGPGDRVAICSGNRSEWCIVDQAILQIGAITVPIYPTSSREDYKYILQHAQVKVCFSSNAEIHAKASQPGGPHHLFTFDLLPGTAHWKDVLEFANEADRPKLDGYRAAVKRDQLATIIYTSGTTGTPKGVMLTHGNVISNVEGSITRFPVDPGAKAISFLPLSHIYERMLMYLYMYSGVSIYFQESLDDLGDRIREVKPEVFTAVPRLLEKIYDKIVSKGNDLTGIKRKLFFWALDLGLRYELEGKGPVYHAQLALARKIIFSKWREALGGNVRVIASGSAALQPRLARVFNAAGIPLMEGYGLTESSPVISVNDGRNNGLRFGSVGKAIPNVEVKVAADGELLARGPNIMIGYYQNPDLTREVVDEEGWLHTGDIGRVDEDGFIFITDRKKEIFKTSGGKYVAPQVLENKMKESRFVEQVMVIGENRKFPAALIVPNFPFLQEYCALKGIEFKDRETIVKDQRINQRIFQDVSDMMAEMGSWERVKKIALLPKEWTIEGGELTPSMKLRRKPMMAKYAQVVEELYAEG